MAKLNNSYYFLRHADTDRSKNVHFSEHELSELGRNQASNIVEKITKFEFDYILCSPFMRAKQTIKPYIDSSGKKLRIEDKLCGRIIKDLPKHETWSFFEKSWNDFDFSIYGAESANSCIQRVASLIENLEKQLDSQKVLLVSHSNPIALYLSKFDQSIGYEWFRNMKTPALYQLNEQTEVLEIDLL